MTTPRVLRLDQLDPDTPGIGGKARGLARLHQLGVAVPPALVLVNARPDTVDDRLIAQATALGQTLAVRSSAIGEDGVTASFAGQYETLLEVSPSEVPDAVRACLASLSSPRAEAYRVRHKGLGRARMSVVIQRMIEPRAAGVLFTADPVTGRRDQLVLDAVSGLGEALVSGHATPDHHRCRTDGSVVHAALAAEHAVLTEDSIRALVTTAHALAIRLGHPLDLEWAIDHHGAIWWLQARPITALPADPRALDVQSNSPNHVYTRCNIGEMMPGAVTPLTLSTTGRGIEVGMQRMYRRIGTFSGSGEGWHFIGCTQGQMLLNLSGIAAYTAGIAGASAEAAAMAICGRAVDELRPASVPGLWKRIRATVRYIGIMRGAPKAIIELRALVSSLQIVGDDAESLYRSLDSHQERLQEAYALHLVSSAGSGALAAALVGILAKGGPPSAEHHAHVAAALAGAEGVESADVVACTQAVVTALRAHPEVAAVSVMSAQEVVQWLHLDHAPGAAWRHLLKTHGHRGYRELSMRTPEWTAAPEGLVAAIRAASAGPEPLPSSSPPVPRSSGLLGLVVGWAHQAVRHRETTKSLLVRTSLEFKRGYRRLGALLQAEGRLADAEQVYFLTHQELGALLGGDAELSELSAKRSAIFPRQDALAMPDVSVGLPEPLAALPAQDGAVSGKPVSRGCARGPVRVVHTLEQATALKTGEILIAPITDVGWTPYFSIIAALVTDLGSAVSHGAVVAREVGLPAVVNTRVGTASFTTGEWVEVDGETGTVRRIDAPSAGSRQP